ncbi:MAG: hypothetical protein AAGB48_10785 [Planctomycetota bacterium]
MTTELTSHGEKLDRTTVAIALNELVVAANALAFAASQQAEINHSTKAWLCEIESHALIACSGPHFDAYQPITEQDDAMNMYVKLDTLRAAIGAFVEPDSLTEMISHEQRRHTPFGFQRENH